MTWDFETEPEFATQLDWIDSFVRGEVEPIDHLIAHGYDMNDPVPAAADLPAPRPRFRTAGCGPVISDRTSGAPATAS